MNFLDQLDPELRAVVEKLPTDRPLDLNNIPTARAKMNKMVTALLATFPAVEGVTSQDQFAPGAKGDPAVRVRVYRPNDQPSKLPALLWIRVSRETDVRAPNGSRPIPADEPPAGRPRKARISPSSPETQPPAARLRAADGGG